jgi:hypothetical protein
MRFKDGVFQGQVDQYTDPSLTLQTLLSSPLLDAAEKQKLQEGSRLPRLFRPRGQPDTNLRRRFGADLRGHELSLFNEDVQKRGQRIPEGTILTAIDPDTKQALGTFRIGDASSTPESLPNIAGSNVGTDARRAAQVVDEQEDGGTGTVASHSTFPKLPKC